MQVVEKFIRSKSGSNIKECEDNFCVTDNYACVVDGATSVTGRLWTSEKITGGRWASQILVDVVKKGMPPTCITASEVVELLTNSIHQAYSKEGVSRIMESEPNERATASIILYSHHLHCLISVGDCQAALINEAGEIFQRIQPTKYNDEVMAQARSMFLQIELTRGGKTIEELRTQMPGRAFIEPLRRDQKLFQNNPKAPDLYQYWVIDGFPVDPSKGITIHKIPEQTKRIILASDGYPILHTTLKETEKELKELIKEDPLLIGKFMSTKGVSIGAESFDDRTFLCIDISENNNSNAPNTTIR